MADALERIGRGEEEEGPLSVVGGSAAMGSNAVSADATNLTHITKRLHKDHTSDQNKYKDDEGELSSPHTAIPDSSAS